MNKLCTTLITCFITAAPAFADKLVRVEGDVGADVQVTYTQSNGQPWTRTKNDANDDGVVEITVPDHVTSVTISKYSDGEWITYDKRI